MLKAEHFFPHATEEKEKRSFAPWNVDPLRSTTLRGIHSARGSHGNSSALNRKSSPFRLGDVGEAQWLLSHRWTETSPILPDVAHDSRNQRRVVSLSALSLPPACVRLRQLREVHHNLQQALNPSPLTDGRRAHPTDGSRAYL